MLNQLQPISMTKPSWEAFFAVADEFLHVSPTRGLDSHKIDPNTPAGYLQCLNMENEPTKSDTRIGDHVHFTFAGCLTSKDVILAISQRTTLSLLCKPCDDGTIILISGTWNQWQLALKKLCSKEVTTQVRKIFNDVHSVFVKNGFTMDARTQGQSDTTFTLT